MIKLSAAAPDLNNPLLKAERDPNDPEVVLVEDPDPSGYYQFTEREQRLIRAGLVTEEDALYYRTLSERLATAEKRAVEMAVHDIVINDKRIGVLFGDKAKEMFLALVKDAQGRDGTRTAVEEELERDIQLAAEVVERITRGFRLIIGERV